MQTVMQTDYVKAALIAGWVLAVIRLGYAFGGTSLAGWALVAVIAVVPPLLLVRLRSGPSRSMSESIRDVVR